MSTPQLCLTYAKMACKWIISHPLRVAIAGVVFWSAFSLLARFGALGLAAAFVCGCAISAIVMLLNRENLAAVARFATLTMMGAFVGTTCLGQIILSEVYLYDHGFGEGEKSLIAGGILGTLIGGLSAESLRKSQN